MPPLHLAKLVVLTYNLNYANPDPATSVKAIAEADADVVLVQEIDAAWQHRLADNLHQRYPHQVFRRWDRAAGGIAVLSKLPIRSEEQLPSPEWFPAQRIVIDSALGAVQILNVHLRPAWDGSWLRGFITTRPMRVREVRSYLPKLAHDVPTIVAGDFNEDASGGAIAYLAKNGLALVPTPPDGPATWHYIDNGRELLHMDIDHVMVDRSLVATDAHVIDAGTSDHRPVIVTVALSSKAP